MTTLEHLCCSPWVWVWTSMHSALLNFVPWCVVCVFINQVTRCAVSNNLSKCIVTFKSVRDECRHFVQLFSFVPLGNTDTLGKFLESLEFGQIQTLWALARPIPYYAPFSESFKNIWCLCTGENVIVFTCIFILYGWNISSLFYSFFSVLSCEYLQLNCSWFRPSNSEEINASSVIVG